MIEVNQELRDVIISGTAGDYVVIDGNTFKLTNGSIELRNLPSVYDVEVYKVIEENHIERPVIEEPIQIVPEEPIEPPQAPQEP